MAGVWIEQDENGRNVKVVSKQPERGVQLVGEGQEVTPTVQAMIDAAKRELSGDSVRGGPDASAVSGNVVTSESTATRVTRK